MPFTLAERSKRYREKAKLNDPDKYEDMKKRAAARVKRARAEKLADPEKRKILLENWRQKQKPKGSAQPDNNSGGGAGSAGDSKNAVCANCSSLAIERNIQRRVERKLLIRINNLQKGFDDLLEKQRIHEQRAKKMNRDVQIIMQKLRNIPEVVKEDISVYQATEMIIKKLMK